MVLDVKPKTALTDSTRFSPLGYGALATSQCLKNIVLRLYRQFEATYLDDVVIHSSTRSDHLNHHREVMGELQKARLMTNPKKCHLELTEAQYFGYHIGWGLLNPQEKKIEALKESPVQPT